MTAIRRRVLLRWAIGIALVLLLLVGIDLAGVVDRLAGASLPLATAGVLGLTAIHLLGALTWRTLVRQLGGVALPWRETVSSYYAAQALGSVTPANLGGDAYRIYALGTAGHRAAASVWPVVVQRATSYLTLSLLAGLALVPLSALDQPVLTVVFVGLVASLVLVGAVLVLLGGPGRRGLLRLLRLAEADAAAAAAAQPVGGSEIGRRRLAVAIAGGVVLGLAFHGASIGLTYLLVISVAPATSALPVLAALAVARLSIALPLTPSGLGVQEGLLALLFGGLGMAPAAALAALLLSRVALLLTGLLGAVALASRPARLGSPAGAGSAKESARNGAPA
jgi:uncharacterized membrane protein YbhN (UPF0104 family)